MNVAEEAVAEELLPYKELFISVVPGQDHKTACFVFTSAGQSCYDKFQCKPNANQMQTKCKPNAPNPIANGLGTS